MIDREKAQAELLATLAEVELRDMAAEYADFQERATTAENELEKVRDTLLVNMKETVRNPDRLDAPELLTLYMEEVENGPDEYDDAIELLAARISDLATRHNLPLKTIKKAISEQLNP